MMDVAVFIAVTAVLGSSRLRGFISLTIGLTIGLIGIDAVSGQARLTFGIPQLGDGIDVVVVAVGIFAVDEALWVAAHLRRKAAEVIRVGRPFMGKQDWKRSWKPWLRGTAYGFPFGAVPAGGAEIPTFLSYITENRLTKHPEEFGKGAIEGVAGGGGQQRQRGRNHGADAVPRSAHQCHGRCDAGRTHLVRHPTWSATAAARKCPGLGSDRKPVHWQHAVAAAQPAAGPVWAKLLRIPRPYLYAGILFFASMGAYAVNGSSFDLILLLALGLLGFVMRRFGLPVLPLIVAVILGPRVELQGRRALQLSSGEWRGLFGSTNPATGEFELSPIAILPTRSSY